MTVSSHLHPVHFVSETSRISYGELRRMGLGERQRRVYDMIQANTRRGVFLTDYELTFQLGLKDPNMVRPRRNELVALGLVEKAGRRRDQYTGKLADTYRVTGSLDDYFFSEAGGVLVQTRMLPRKEWDHLRERMEGDGYQYMGAGVWKHK